MNTVELLTTIYNQYKFSDFHLHVGQPPIARIDGDIVRIDMPVLTQKEVHDMLLQIMSEKHRTDFDKRLELDFSFSIENVCRFRVNVYYETGNMCGVFRAITYNIKSLEELGFPPTLRTIANHKQGLVLVTGQKGSGKSTTLAAMLNYINQTQKKHIVTIEDPIEYIYQSKNSLFSQRQVESDTHSFANALRSSLREDSDILLVGEIRDLETIRLALTAAETGQLVLSTLHTHNAVASINRIVDFFPGKEKTIIRTQLSHLLQAVISQSLVKKKMGGRIVAHEIMVCTPAIRNLIRESNHSEIRAAIKSDKVHGMHSLDQHLQNLVKQDIITFATAQQYGLENDLSVSYEKTI